MNPTGACLSTPSVPRKSRSPSALTWPERIAIPSAVATAFSVTPAQATSASSSMSPEQSSSPLPPVGGMQPGGGERAAGLDLARDRAVVERAAGAQRDVRGFRVGAVALLQRRLQGAEVFGVHSRSSLVGDLLAGATAQRVVALRAPARRR